MSKILVPSDFSLAADTALVFAAQLARSKQSSLVILHVYSAPVPVQGIPYGFLKEELELIRSDREKRMLELRSQIKELESIAYTCLVEEGETVETILKLIDIEHPEILVMGARGKNGLSNTIFGGTTSKIIESTSVPVFAIPAKICIHHIARKYTFASDLLETDIQTVLELVELARTARAQINVLHVSEKSELSLEKTRLIREFREKIFDSAQYNQLSFELIIGPDVITRLLEYITDGGTDVLVLSTQNRGFFEKLFSASVTKKIIQKTEIPVLAFHHQERKRI